MIYIIETFRVLSKKMFRVIFKINTYVGVDQWWSRMLLKPLNKRRITIFFNLYGDFNPPILLYYINLNKKKKKKKLKL